MAKLIPFIFANMSQIIFITDQTDETSFLKLEVRRKN